MRLERARPRLAALIVAATIPLFAGSAVFAGSGESGESGKAGEAEALPVGAPAQLDITFLANEAFLVRADGRAVLIDAFVREPYLQYSAVPESVLVAMGAGEPPFDEVVLALVSHAHADHHQGAVARDYLASRPDVVLVTSPQVMAQTFPEPADGAPAGARPGDDTVLPAPGESVSRTVRGVEVEFLGLPHGGESHGAVENLGHVITFGGRRVLHVGDAAQDAEIFAPLDLPSRELDVALVPYWYLRTKSGRNFLDEYIGADWYVACHVPPAEVAEVSARLGFRMRNLRVPAAPLETFRY